MGELRERYRDPVVRSRFRQCVDERLQSFDRQIRPLVLVGAGLVLIPILILGIDDDGVVLGGAGVVLFLVAISGFVARWTAAVLIRVTTAKSGVALGDEYCHSCGYDVTGCDGADRCPECGEAIDGARGKGQ